jgi:hypothetical protein
MKITDTEIREHLGHDGDSCRVRITRTGEVHRYGSPDAFDRSQDFWHFFGWRDEVVDQIEAEEGERK